MQYSISIIIPTYNEEEFILPLLIHLQAADPDDFVKEVIVVDGGSTDRTIERAISAGARTLVASKRGRAAQMNEGARAASGLILYFLHADTMPPFLFPRDIIHAVGTGASSGCFRLAFDHPHWVLRLSGWVTRFDVDAIRFGDQSLFVRREIFEGCGGFDERMRLMEDQEIISRLKPYGRFVVLPRAVVTSARKYRKNGIVRLQGTFAAIYLLYRLGSPQDQLVRFYRKHITENR